MGSLREAVRAIVPITHGAAVAGIDANGLALPVPDYEFKGFDERPADWRAQFGAYSHSLSPLLPLGLNLATQLDWLERHHSESVAQVEQWLPYPQYWAWWFSGVAATEVSSLGCHTGLWQPATGQWSELAVRRGWAKLFAPLHKAWDVVGVLRPELALYLGLPKHTQIVCGAHDSNACLARYLRAWPHMTLVSSGTWVIVMACGASLAAVNGDGDVLANVSVLGQAVPTGRFMGGRHIERICAGAAPAKADAALALRWQDTGVQVASGGEQVCLDDVHWQTIEQLGNRFDARERATLAALYAAQETARCVSRIGAQGPFVVDGPLASNATYLQVLAQLLDEVYASIDPIEGTAGGGVALAAWQCAEPQPPLLRKVVLMATPE
jgi:sugar (pentulose or hexulose) kinase